MENKNCYSGSALINIITKPFVSVSIILGTFFGTIIYIYKLMELMHFVIAFLLILLLISIIININLALKWKDLSSNYIKAQENRNALIAIHEGLHKDKEKLEYEKFLLFNLVLSQNQLNADCKLTLLQIAAGEEFTNEKKLEGN